MISVSWTLFYVLRKVFKSTQVHSYTMDYRIIGTNLVLRKLRTIGITLNKSIDQNWVLADMDVDDTIEITIRKIDMRTILTISIVLAALILIQASSSKEFTFVETVKNCNCMDYLKWKNSLYFQSSLFWLLAASPIKEDHILGLHENLV